MKKILAVTGCPTGIAHTYMAEEALKAAAQKLGVDIKVETNGASGIDNQISADEIAQADGIIIAADKDVNIDRFNGKPVIEVPVKEGIHKATALIEQILAGNVPIRQGARTSQSQPQTTANSTSIHPPSFGRQVYKHLMNGVSNMLPFVVAGGVLIALSFLWGIYSANPQSEQYNAFAALLMNIGGQAFGIMVPVFTAFIAASIAGRPGMVAGFVGGLIANVTGAGFLGGIIAGFAAGYLMLYLKKWLDHLPRQFEGLKSIFILPLIGVFVIGAGIFLLGEPIATINTGMQSWLSSLQSANPILLGIVIGAMCSFDFGGPVNKAAYVTGTVLLASGNFYFMAGVSAACIVPPFVIAFSTTIFRKKAFTEDERAAGLVNYILGATHITEGAIPFAAKDPLRVIPIMMIASSIAAVLTFLSGIEVPAPHGGFLVLPLVNKPLTWVMCIFAGALVGALLLGFSRMAEIRKHTGPLADTSALD
ncbi:PTS fructose transporter subunit IIBC [Utexia brackfieldae]|uniref:PTS fructose transporter subunit IIC n=1 Tax=Utexia brackfieldae TaxID=3074108 RepID=UPI00370DADAD